MTKESKNPGGRPRSWGDEQPKQRVNISITPEAIARLDERAEFLGVSRSELIEQFARGMIGQPGTLSAEEQQALGELYAS